jgi:hypothetical protein
VTKHKSQHRNHNVNDRFNNRRGLLPTARSGGAEKALGVVEIGQQETP